MKTFCTFLAAWLFTHSIIGQSSSFAPDTLLIHTFEGILDPADSMLTQPTGDDLHWINYDQDNKTGLCVINGITPKGWYWESDLGVTPPALSDNFAFTSCSYLSSADFRNRNWLITSPVYIPDNTYWLCWKSLSYYGPDIMDGYQVLASTTTNFPASFTDTLFSVAETKFAFEHYSLDTADYIFSKGYIHANSYTDTSYFFIDYENGFPFYHGKLEPHSLSLAEYAGQMVYLAFLHDSKDHYQIQVDDILVSNSHSSAQSLSNLLYFNILPNPVSDFAFINWKSRTPQAGRLQVLDQTGKVVFEKQFNARTDGQIHFDAQGLASGIYYCKLQTATGHATKVLVKI